MTDYLLSIAADATKDSYNWLIAASLPPLMYLIFKKGNKSKLKEWLQRLLIKKAMKRARKGKDMTVKGLAGWVIAFCVVGLIISIIIKSSPLGIISFILGLAALATFYWAKQYNQ